MEPPGRTLQRIVRIFPAWTLVLRVIGNPSDWFISFLTLAILVPLFLLTIGMLFIPGVVPPQFFIAFAILNVVAFCFAIVEIGFSIHDHRALANLRQNEIV